MNFKNEVVDKNLKMEAYINRLKLFYNLIALYNQKKAILAGTIRSTKLAGLECMVVSRMSDTEVALRSFLQRITKEQGYEDCNISLQLFSTGGANYTSHLYRVTISESGRDDLRLFAKVACVSEAIRAQFSLAIYDYETFFYTDLLPAYQKLEERHQVPRQHRLAAVKYYGSCSDYLSEILLLEDLSSKGFELHDRLKSFDWEYAAKSVEEMAKLHALSIALFKESPEEFNSLSSKFDLSIFIDQLKKMMKDMTQAVLSIVKEKNREKVERFLESCQNLDADFYYQVRQVAVITHGDFRPSNLMHRRRENGAMEVFVLDYQTPKISNPISDLMYFIFSGSDEKFREKHYHQLLDHYYKELCDALTRLEVDSNKVYPKDDFEYELKEIQPFGLLMGIMIMPMIAVEAENAPDMSTSTGYENLLVKPNELAAARVNGIVDDFVKLGIL